MARTKKLTIRVSPDELVRLTAAARERAMGLSSWVRHKAWSELQDSPAPASCQPLPPRHPPPQHPLAMLTHRERTFLTEEQFAALDEHARACGLSLSAFIRKELLGLEPVARRSVARSAIVAVNRAGNDLNRVIQLASSGTLLAPELMSAVAGLREEIHALRDALLTADADAIPEPHA